MNIHGPNAVTSAVTAGKGLDVASKRKCSSASAVLALRGSNKDLSFIARATLSAKALLPLPPLTNDRGQLPPKCAET
jgi:hypothetical protein